MYLEVDSEEEFIDQVARFTVYADVVRTTAVSLVEQGDIAAVGYSLSFSDNRIRLRWADRESCCPYECIVDERGGLVNPKRACTD